MSHYWNATFPHTKDETRQGTAGTKSEKISANARVADVFLRFFMLIRRAEGWVTAGGSQADSNQAAQTPGLFRRSSLTASGYVNGVGQASPGTPGRQFRFGWVSVGFTPRPFFYRIGRDTNGNDLHLLGPVMFGNFSGGRLLFLLPETLFSSLILGKFAVGSFPAVGPVGGFALGYGFKTLPFHRIKPGGWVVDAGARLLLLGHSLAFSSLSEFRMVLVRGAGRLIRRLGSMTKRGIIFIHFIMGVATASVVVLGRRARSRSRFR